MSELLGVDQVRVMLREIVAEFPDGYFYEQVEWLGERACVYSVEGEPSCLIGHLFHRLNIVVSERNQPMPVAHIDGLYGLFTGRAILYISAVQRAQDSGMPWFAALEFADNTWLDSVNTNRSDDVAPQATV